MIDFMGSGWVWLSASLGLLILEMLVSGFLFLSFSAAAGVTGILMLTGVWPFSTAPSLVLAASFSWLLWIALPKLLPDRRGSVRLWRSDINGNDRDLNDHVRRLDQVQDERIWRDD